MAPTFQSQFDPASITHIDMSSLVYANSCYNDPRYVPRKVETKKEKQERIATERMHASRKTFNQKTAHQIEIKQLCKPRHLNILKFTYLKK